MNKKFVIYMTIKKSTKDTPHKGFYKETKKNENNELTAYLTEDEKEAIIYPSDEEIIKGLKHAVKHTNVITVRAKECN